MADTPVTEFTFETIVPPSTKNNRIIGRTRGGRTFSRKSLAAQDAIEQIREDIEIELGRRGFEPGELGLFGEAEVEVQIEHLVQEHRCRVRVRVLGPKPTGRTPSGRKRDLQNLQEGILDAMQELVFSNDRQVGRLVMWRNTKR